MRITSRIRRIPKPAIIAMAIVGIVGLLSGAAYALAFGERIMPDTWFGAVALGGMTRDEAGVRLQEALDHLDQDGIRVIVGDDIETIRPEAIGLDLNLSEALDRAFDRGHQGRWTARLGARLGSLWKKTELEAPITLDEAALGSEIGDIALASDIARVDVRLGAEGSAVTLLTDTRPGRVIDRDDAVRRIVSAVRSFSDEPVALTLVDDPPRADPEKAVDALNDAQRMTARPLTLIYEDAQFTVKRERLASWLVSEYDGDQLLAGLDKEAIGAYVTTVAKELNVDPVPPEISTQEGRVTGFVPPKVGRAVEEDKLVGLITDVLIDRAGAAKKGDVIPVPIKTTKMGLTGLDAESGITEIVGKATTTFKGSPKNRISNIKNGVKFLSGALVQPGEEFSALGTLGTIDNTTGYLPELVIKGDRTIPEFGGGLCQVSTTLFRAVMDAGLPITARRNHSFRVSYYEKDGNGVFIGPGLDATIYEPNLDFRFRNDMSTPILVIGYVAGDKVTFELYGTDDGRTSKIVGPTLLTEIPAGEPEYIETLDLAPGVVKQVETPHPGGSTIATYTVTYPDGHEAAQEFTSWYRRWPAKYLKGVAALTPPSPSPTPFPVTAP